jgi:hypothetical protein
MRTPQQALDWLAHEAAHPTQDWAGYCERLARTAYGLPAVYPDAAAHFADVPTAHRHGTATPPPAGAHLIYRNSGKGHIVTATGHGWQVWTNDSPVKRGRVHLIDDGRTLAPWCHATAWYAADPWFRGQTHTLRWGTSAPPFPGTITPGARGSAVRAWQAEMVRLGWLADTPGNADGFYGEATQRKARDMQRRLGVPVDAILGPVTYSAMEARGRV